MNQNCRSMSEVCEIHSLESSSSETIYHWLQRSNSKQHCLLKATATHLNKDTRTASPSRKRTPLLATEKRTRGDKLWNTRRVRVTCDNTCWIPEGKWHLPECWLFTAHDAASYTTVLAPVIVYELLHTLVITVTMPCKLRAGHTSCHARACYICPRHMPYAVEMAVPVDTLASSWRGWKHTPLNWSVARSGIWYNLCVCHGV